MTKQKLDFSSDDLFIGKTVSICNNSITITPVNIEQVALLSHQLKFLVSKFKEDGITMENFNSPENLFSIVMLVIKDVPEVLSELTNIHVESIKKLPPDEALKLMIAVVEVNSQSKDSLLGNLNSLIEKLLPEDMEKEDK